MRAARFARREAGPCIALAESGFVTLWRHFWVEGRRKSRALGAVLSSRRGFAGMSVRDVGFRRGVKRQAVSSPSLDWSDGKPCRWKSTGSAVETLLRL